jgi:hypothetical protein
MGPRGDIAPVYRHREQVRDASGVHANVGTPPSMRSEMSTKIESRGRLISVWL